MTEFNGNTKDANNSAINNIIDRINAEPAYRNLLYKIMDFFREEHSSSEFQLECLTWPEMKVVIQTPLILLSWLVNCNAVVEIKSSIITKEEKTDFHWKTTATGIEVLNIQNPDNQLKNLIDNEDSIYQPVFKEVLKACLVPHSRTDIEKMLDGRSYLETPKVYASYFLEALEKAGGLEFDNKWKTTLAGEALVNNNY